MNTELNTHNNTRLIEVDVAKAFAILKFIVYFPVGSLTVDNPYDLLRKTHR